MWILTACIGGTVQNVDPKVLIQYYPSIIFAMCFSRCEDQARSCDLLRCFLHQYTEEREVANQEWLLC
jgi:hypothetical protein